MAAADCKPFALSRSAACRGTSPARSIWWEAAVTSGGLGQGLLECRFVGLYPRGFWLEVPGMAQLPAF